MPRRAPFWSSETVFKKLPSHVRFIISASLDWESALVRVVTPENLIVFLPMAPEEGETLLDLWLHEAGRTLQPHQRRTVLERFANFRFPLYLKLIFEQARYWKSYQNDVEVGPNTPTVIRGLFRDLSANHCSTMVSWSLASLVAAKNGMMDQELLDVLSEDFAVMEEYRCRFPLSPSVKTLPPIMWSRLYFDLAPYLINRNGDGVCSWRFSAGSSRMR